MIEGVKPALAIVLELNARLSFAHDVSFNDELSREVGTALDLLLNDFGIPLSLTIEVRAAELETDFKLLVAGSPLDFSREALSIVAGAVESFQQVYAIDPRRYLAHKAGQVDSGVLHRMALGFLIRAVVSGLAQQLDRLVDDRVAAAYGAADADHEQIDENVLRPPPHAVCSIMKAVLLVLTSLENRREVVPLILDGQRRELRTEAIAETIIARLRPGTLDIEIERSYAEDLIGRLDETPAPVAACGLATTQLEPFNMLVDGLFYELGVRVPPIRLCARQDLPANTFVFWINHLSTPSYRGLAPTQLLVNDTADQLALLKIEGTPTINPANGSECAIIGKESGAVAEQGGLTTWDPFGYLALALAAEIRRNARCFIDLDAVEYELQLLGQAFPDIVAEWLQQEPLVRLTRILRTLLGQGVSIRNLRAILHLVKTYDFVLADSAREIVLDDRLALDERAPLTDDSTEYEVAFVRKGFRQYLGHKYTRGSNTLVVYLLDSMSVEGPILAQGQNLAKQQLKDIRRAIDDEVGTLPSTAASPVILTTTSVAVHLRNLLAGAFPGLPILAYEELPFDLNVQPIARISVA